MDNQFSFKAENIKENANIPEGIINTSAPSFSPNPNVTEAPVIKPTEPASVRSKNTLIFLTIILGVIALIATTICIWLLVDKTKSSTITSTTETTKSEATKETEITAKTLGFFPKKIENPAADVTYRLGVHRNNQSGNGVFGAYINTENSRVELYIYWQFIGDYYGIDTGGRTDRELAQITFDQPIADIALGESGQTVSGDVLLFLLQDGTVEYMPVVKALKSHNFESSGKMGGLTDIVKFYHTDAIDTNGDFSGYITTLAQKADGKIYDLQGFMRSATAE